MTNDAEHPFLVLSYYLSVFFDEVSKFAAHF